MPDKKTGRKQDFPEEEQPRRVSIILPQSIITALDIFAVTSPLTRNQIINQAIQEFLEKSSSK